MADAALVRLSLAEAADGIRRRALSPVELAEAVLAQIDALNPTLNAFITLVPREQVLAPARAAEREIAAGAYRGLLHGIPVSVKDLIDTAGLRTTYGSGMFRDQGPEPDPLTRAVRDAALAAQALAGFDPEHFYSRPGPPPDLLGGLEGGVRGLRVGTSPDLLLTPPEPEVRAAYEATLRRLEKLGARLVEVRLPHHDLVLRTIMALFAIEGGVGLDAIIGDRPRVFGPQVQRIMEITPPLTVPMCVRTQQRRQLVARDYQAAFVEADVLVAPVAPMPAPRIDTDEFTFAPLCGPYCGAANLAGIPSVPLPAGTSGGLPVAIQIMAPAGADALALRVAYTLEQAAPEHRVQVPPLAARA